MTGNRSHVPSMAGLLAFVCALVLVDTVFFTALTPLLPHYTREAGLSKAGPACWSRAIRPGRWWGRCQAGCWSPGSASAGWRCSGSG